jgi:RNA polymerase sigma-70 factor (ECF subfamily)
MGKRFVTNTTCSTLLERIRNGSDPLAWNEFWDRYWRAIFRFARFRGCSEPTAEEVVQDAMLTLFEKRQVFRYDPAAGRFRDWLGGMVRNLVNKRRGHRAERVRAAGGSDPGPLEQAADPHAPADEAWQQIFDENLLHAVLDIVRGEVAPATYQAFELVAVEGVSADEAARLTGLSRNAVYLARKRIMERLRELSESYRKEGQLLDRVRRALQSTPSPAVERSMTNWMETSAPGTMGRRQGSSPARN